MEGWKVVNVLNKYKKCPCCGSSNKDTEMKIAIKDNTLRVYCSCGFDVLVDENNKVLSQNSYVESKFKCPNCSVSRKYRNSEEVIVVVNGVHSENVYMHCNCNCGLNFLVSLDDLDEESGVYFEGCEDSAYMYSCCSCNTKVSAKKDINIEVYIDGVQQLGDYKGCHCAYCGTEFIVGRNKKEGSK